MCPCCSKIQPLRESTDNFQVLGLDSRRLSLDTESLEEAFYALSRQVHPDRYQGLSPAERRMAEERSAALNVAYRTLRDPVARTEYLLELEGASGGEAQGRPGAGLLMEVMEVQETIEAYRGSEGPEREALGESLQGSLQELEARIRETAGELEEAFGLWDRSVLEEGSGQAKGALLERFGELLARRRYLATATRDIRAALASGPAPEGNGGR